MAPPKRRGKLLTVETKPYQCLFCSNNFFYYKLLECHTNLHTGERPYECQECGEVFTYSSYLKRHQALVHLGQRYHCKLCSASYAGNQYLRVHMDSVHYGKKYICQGCRTQYSSNITLKRHRDGGFCTGVKKILFSSKMRKLRDKRHKEILKTVKKEEKPNKNRKFPCEMVTGNSRAIGGTRKKLEIKGSAPRNSKARKITVPKTELKTETNEKSAIITKRVKKNGTILKKEEVNYESIKRRRSSASRKPVPKTKVSNLKTKPVETSKMELSSENDKILKPLMKNISPWKIPVVNKTVKKKLQLFKCSLCPTSYSDRNLFWRHASACHGRQIFECSVCENVYTDYSNLVRHIKTSHQNDKDMKVLVSVRNTTCDKCNLKFDSYSKLMEHKKENHDLKVYQCTYCTKKYTDHSNMLRHRKVHDRVGNQNAATFRRQPEENGMVSKDSGSTKLDSFPAIGIVLEKKAKMSMNDSVLQLINNLKNERQQQNELFFLHLNRYDPSSV